jgi:outer membrane biosynthesis protein TonB
MKPTAGYAKPRRITAPVRRSRLNLQRRPKPAPEDEIGSAPEGNFWKWVIVVALLHVLVIAGAYLYFLFTPAVKPDDHFMSLLPPGDTVRGTPGAQQAHKLGQHTPAAPSHHAAPPPPAATAPAPPQVVTPPVVKPPTPTPILKDNAPSIIPVKPTPPKPTSPPKPKIKVKVDLNLVDAPDTAEPAPKPAKHHAKKPVKTTDEAQDDADSTPDNTGLSKEQIAKKLGEKLNASGSRNAIKTGESGAPNGNTNRYQDYYDLIKQQIQQEWNSPMVPVETDPIIGMHVERDGRVPPESVHLIRSSGNSAYDDSALATVRRLGSVQEPLPPGCPPDMTLNFNPNP